MEDPVLPSQREAARFIADRGTAYLADEMRVGKTPSAIRAADLMGASRILWLTTGAARTGHAKAWERFSALSRPVQIIGSGGERIVPEGVTITSYDLAAGPLFARLMAGRYDMLVEDEAHRLKNRTAKRTKAVYGENFDRVGGLAGRADAVVPLSGTPAPNDPSELWPVLHALFPQSIMRENGTPMPWSIFLPKFCRLKSNGFGQKIVGGRNLDELRERIAPYFLRRKFADVFPDAAGISVDQIFVDAQTNLDELRELEHGGLLENVKRRLERARDDEARSAILHEVDLSLAMRLRRLTGTAKVPGVAAWCLEQIADGRKVVVFGHHKDVLDGMQAALAKHKPVRISGGVGPKAKAEAEALFATDAHRVFIGNITAAGEAIDLSSADDVVFVESSWVPGDNDQAARRIVNLGKTRENVAWFATLAGSIDEQIQRTVMRKTADLLKIFG